MTSGTATITVHQAVGGDGTFFLPIGNGENFGTILATNGELIPDMHEPYDRLADRFRRMCFSSFFGS
jgi:hypothetical protein